MFCNILTATLFAIKVTLHETSASSKICLNIFQKLDNFIEKTYVFKWSFQNNDIQKVLLASLSFDKIE